MATRHFGEHQFLGGVSQAAGSYSQETVATGLTAAGANLAAALALTSAVNVVSTAASGTGVALPTSAPIGSTVVVQNLGANDLKVYPHSASGTINGASTGVALTLTTANRQIGEFRRVSATAWMATVSNGPQT